VSLLEDYIKDLNYIETARREKKFTRIRSIDFVKGFAICLIILAHASEQWIVEEFLFAYGLIYCCLDVFGPSLFIFLSALSVVFSLRKKMGYIPEKAIRNNIFFRGIVIILLGILFNFGSRQDLPFPMNLWGWNILVFIGFSQIFCYYALKFARGTRVIIGLIIIFITEPIRDALYYWKDKNIIVWIIHYMLISPSPHLTFIPYLSLCFFSTIFGEMFFETMLLETKEAYLATFKTFIQYGFLLTFVGIMLGLDIMNPENTDPNEYFFVSLVYFIRNQDYFDYPGMYKFQVRGTPANMFYSLGMALIILGISFYYVDIKQKENNFINTFIFYGRVSLSLFLISYIGLFLYYRFLTIFTFLLVAITYIAFLGILMYIWNKYFNGKYSFEWIMVNLTGKSKKKKINP